jgi:hypothetical protein
LHRKYKSEPSDNNEARFKQAYLVARKAKRTDIATYENKFLCNPSEKSSGILLARG